MADSFQKLDYLPPVRLTVQEVAQITDELAGQVASGGDVEVELRVDFEDGTTFTRDSTQGFLANLDPEGEPIHALEIRVTSWGPRPLVEIAKSVHVQLRHFGSQFIVVSKDPVWGLGEVGALKRRFGRHTPWYAPILRWVGKVAALLIALPVIAILAAIAHEEAITPLLVVVVVLSLLSLAILIWVMQQEIHSRGAFAHTAISRKAGAADWLWLKVIAAGVALGADAATLIVLLAR